MSYKEKSIFVSLFQAIIVFGIYSNYMFGKYQDGYFSGADADALMGKSIFVLIGLSIVVAIVLHILMAIVNAMITGEDEDTKSDERDELIELKGMQISFIAFSIGFLAAMAALAFNVATPAVFFVIILSMFFGNIVGDGAKLYFYRKGL